MLLCPSRTGVARSPWLSPGLREGPAAVARVPDPNPAENERSCAAQACVRLQSRPPATAGNAEWPQTGPPSPAHAPPRTRLASHARGSPASAAPGRAVRRHFCAARSCLWAPSRGLPSAGPAPAPGGSECQHPALLGLGRWLASAACGLFGAPGKPGMFHVLDGCGVQAPPYGFWVLPLGHRM